MERYALPSAPMPLIGWGAGMASRCKSLYLLLFTVYYADVNVLLRTCNLANKERIDG